MQDPKIYWQTYYQPEIVHRSNKIRQEFYIPTSGVTLHVDAYLQSDPNLPVILINHGEGGYSRMFVHVALGLYDQKFSVLVVDQRGHGYSSGSGIDFTLSHLIQDVLDGIFWARRSFSGPLFVIGVNQGGGMVYQAAGMGAPVLGLICHHLYDFSNFQDMLAGTRYRRVNQIPGGAFLVNGMIRMITAFSPRFTISYDTLNQFDGLLDERDNGNFEAWQTDPNPARKISMRYALSTFTTQYEVPYEENKLPILVINPTRDRMISPQISKRNYDRLGGPKRYVEMDYGHWSLTPDFSQLWSNIVDDWIKGILAR